MHLTEIKRLIKLVESSAIEELEIHEEGIQIRISKGKAVAMPQTTNGAPSVTHAVSHPVQQVKHAYPELHIHEAKIEPITSDESDNLVKIQSPMVGTFYQSPSPDSPPYVRVGDEINPGKILCIVEAMKLMNEIEAEISGKIVKVLVQNGQPIEYNQPLFLVEKA
jgi:acetyl-CoA carboxylase biotin carboxyl carrier protein